VRKTAIERRSSTVRTRGGQSGLWVGEQQRMKGKLVVLLVGLEIDGEWRPTISSARKKRRSVNSVAQPRWSAPQAANEY
jgi:hypothetical protein